MSICNLKKNLKSPVNGFISQVFINRSSLHREKAPDPLPNRDKNLDSPFDLLITAGKISLMVHEDSHLSIEVLSDFLP